MSARLTCPRDGVQLRKRTRGWTCYVCHYVAPQREVKLGTDDDSQLSLVPAPPAPTPTLDLPEELVRYCSCLDRRACTCWLQREAAA